MKMFGQKVITAYDKYIDNESLSVVVTLDSSKEYYNVYVITEKYKIDPLNCLKLQVPVESVKDPENYFDTSYMVERLMEYIIWDRFYEHGLAEVNLSINFIPHIGPDNE